MNAYTFKKCLLPIVASLGLVAPASATIWYSSFDPAVSVISALSRVDGSGNPLPLKRFNVFNLTGFQTLSVIHFYAPQVAPMYSVELRIGGANTPAIWQRTVAAPLLVQSHPIFTNKVTIAVPNTLLWPGTWSISVATDGRFSTGQAFWSEFSVPGWALFIATGTTGPLSLVNPMSGLMIQLADSL